jgi:hypothetical protein
MHIFDAPDLEGVQALRCEEFVEHDGMLFRGSVYDQRRVSEALAKGVPEATLQFQMNHQSLISYAGDRAQQLRVADDVQADWLARIEKQFPGLYPWVMIEISPSEVILSLRAVRR